MTPRIASSRFLKAAGCPTFIVLCALASNACDTSGEASTGDRPPSRQILVVVDLSGSRTGTELEHSKEMIHGLVRRLGVGDQMAVMPLGDRRVKRLPPRLHTIPKRNGRSRPEAVRNDIRADVNALFETGASTSKETDILFTLFQVRDYVLEAGGRRVDLVVLSDMIQDAADMNFTRVKDIPTKAWIDAQRAKSLMPKLEGVCVTVVGADSSTKEGVARREFWQSYFAAAGAKLSTERYRQTLTQFDGALCDG